MKLRETPNRVREWLRRSRRRRIGAAGLGLGMLTAGIALPLYFAVFAGGGGGPAVSPPPPSPVARPTPAVSTCATPPLIEPPEATASDDWQELSLPPVNHCFSIVADESDASGVALDSAFVLEVKEPLDIASLVSRLQVEPDLELDIEPLSDSEVSVRPAALPAAAARYRIQPGEPLSEDTVYRFSILDEPGGLPIRTWAFQSQRALRVVQTLPADQSTDVPLNIGIELNVQVGAEQHVDAYRRQLLARDAAHRFRSLRVEGGADRHVAREGREPVEQPDEGSVVPLVIDSDEQGEAVVRFLYRSLGRLAGRLLAPLGEDG